MLFDQLIKLNTINTVLLSSLLAIPYCFAETKRTIEFNIDVKHIPSHSLGQGIYYKSSCKGIIEDPY